MNCTSGAGVDRAADERWAEPAKFNRLRRGRATMISSARQAVCFLGRAKASAPADGAASFPRRVWEWSLPMTTIAREPAEILLIDEDSHSRRQAAAVLEEAGYLLFQAAGRLDALKIARLQALDLLICDVNVGGQSGLELCRELRKLPGMLDVPVMFVSSTQVPDIVRRSHDAGGAYYLRKPLDPEVLLDLVGKALWMPHLVQSRLSMHEAAVQPVPPPQKVQNARVAAVQGIRLPLA